MSGWVSEWVEGEDRDRKRELDPSNLCVKESWSECALERVGVSVLFTLSLSSEVEWGVSESDRVRVGGEKCVRVGCRMYVLAFRGFVDACVCVSLILIRRARSGTTSRVFMWVCVNAPTKPGTSFSEVPFS